MIKLFAVVYDRIIEGLEDSVNPPHINTYYLLNELKKLKGIEVSAYSFNQLPKKGLLNMIYNNIIKTEVAFQSAISLMRFKPIVYFAYPASLTTIQNRTLFWFCVLLRLNVVLRIHDTFEQADVVGAKKFALNENQESYYFRKATLILALNEPMWRHIKNKYKIQNKRVIFLHNAFDSVICRMYSKIYKPVENRFNICYIGGLTKNRGVDILVKASEDLNKKYPFVKLYLFSSYGRETSEELRNIIEGSSFIVRKHVPRKDLMQALKDIDVFVMPYNPKESYMNFSSPTKFFEYIGTCKPILCTKCESLLEIGKDGGIIYIDYDAKDLKEKIEMLILNPPIREELSLELMKIRPLHTWGERAKKLQCALESLYN